MQFRSVDAVEIPPVYLATPKEIAERLRATAKRRRDRLNVDQRHVVLERLKKYQQLGCFRSTELRFCHPVSFYRPKG